MKNRQSVFNTPARPILFLAGWYPTPEDPQDGVFVRKHAIAASTFHEVVVLSVIPSAKEATTNTEKNGSLTEYSASYIRSDLPVIGPAINFFRFIQTIRESTATILQKHNPALVHVHILNRHALPALWLSLTRGMPYLVTEHWTGYVSGDFQKLPVWRKWMMKTIARRAVLMTVVSPALKTAIEGLDFHKDVRILPNVVECDHSVSESARTQKSASSRRIRMLNVSDLYDRKKNVSGLLLALSTLIQEGLDLELHLIGDGPDRDNLLSLASQLPGLEDRLIYAGRLPNQEVLKAMNTADFYVCPSHIETFSVTTAEALAAGKPVVCTACGGPESFVKPDCGFVIPKGDQLALEAGIRRMSSEYVNYEPAVLKQTIRQFATEAIGRKMADLYEELSNDSDFRTGNDAAAIETHP